MSDKDFNEFGWYTLPDEAWTKVVNVINEKKSPGYPKVLTCKDNAACLQDQTSLRMELEQKINGLYLQGLCLIDQLNAYDFRAFTDLNDPDLLRAHALSNYTSGVREFVQLTDKGEGRPFGKLQRLVCAVDLSDNNVERLLFGDWMTKSMDKHMGDTCMAPRLDIMTEEALMERLKYYDSMAEDVEGLTGTDQPGFEYGVQLQDYVDHMFKALHDHDCLVMENFQDGEPDYIKLTPLALCIIGFYYSNLSRVYVTNEGKMFVNLIPGIQVSGRYMTFKLNSDVRAMRSFTVNAWLPAVLAVHRDFMTLQHFAHDVTVRYDFTYGAQTESRIAFGLMSLSEALTYTMAHWFCETAGDDCVEISAYRTLPDFERAYRWFGWNVTDTVVQKGEYDFCSTKFTPKGAYQVNLWKSLFVRCYKNTEVTDLLNFFLPFKNHPEFTQALPYLLAVHPDAVIAFACDYCKMGDHPDLRAIQAYRAVKSLDEFNANVADMEAYYEALRSVDNAGGPTPSDVKAFLDAFARCESMQALERLRRLQ